MTTNTLRTEINGVIVTTSHTPATGCFLTQVIGGSRDGECRVALTQSGAEANHGAICFRVKRDGVRAR